MCLSWEIRFFFALLVSLNPVFVTRSTIVSHILLLIVPENFTHTHIVRWRMDQSFCYPRMGAFEVFVKKGTQRVEVPVFLATFSQKFQNLATLIHFSNTLTKVTQNIGVFSAVSAPAQPEASLRKVEKALPSEASATAARRKATRGLSRWAVK